MNDVNLALHNVSFRVIQESERITYVMKSPEDQLLSFITQLIRKMDGIGNVWFEFHSKSTNPSDQTNVSSYVLGGLTHWYVELLVELFSDEFRKDFSFDWHFVLIDGRCHLHLDTNRMLTLYVTGFDPFGTWLKDEGACELDGSQFEQRATHHTSLTTNQELPSDFIQRLLDYGFILVPSA